MLAALIGRNHDVCIVGNIGVCPSFDAKTMPQKKPTWRNTLGYSTTSAYSRTSLSAWAELFFI